MNPGSTAGITPRGNPASQWLNSRTLQTKILAAIILMAAVASAVGILGISRMSTMNTSTQDLYNLGLIPLNRVQAVQTDMATTRQDVLDYVISTDSANRTKYDQAIRDDDARYSADLDIYAKQTDAPELVAQLRADWAAYQKDRAQTLAAGRRGDSAEVERLRNQVTGPEAAKASAIVAAIVQRETADAKRRVDLSNSTYQSARTLTISVLCVGILLALAFGVLISRLIIGSVRKVSHVVDGLAQGDLTRRAEVHSSDEIGQMATGLDHAVAKLNSLIAEFNHLAVEHGRGDIDVRADASKHQGDFQAIVNGVNHTLDAIIDPLIQVTDVLTAMAEGDLTQSITTTYAGRLEKLRLAVNNTITKLAETVGTVIDSADQINQASRQISGASQSMSQAATEQAASVEETTASIEQMAAGITQNSDNATLTEGIATKAAADAGDGGSAVQETVDVMKQIASKITIIDDIAFQTNMLALNATIEAARAGEHGKGFAVVATEVGKLAERSQIAAQEISELAAGSVNTAERAGALLHEIVPSITKTADLVQEIASASSEQTTGVRQINTAMTQISKITQQNASSSEELAATAEEMAAQTAQLQNMMAFFTTSGSRNSAGGGAYGNGSVPGNGVPGWPVQPSSVRIPVRQAASHVPDVDDTKFDRF